MGGGKDSAGSFAGLLFLFLPVVAVALSFVMITILRVCFSGSPKESEMAETRRDQTSAIAAVLYVCYGSEESQQVEAK